ncbi:hypothetical protein MNBD_GAMMA17-1772 [hydrothermal vent metagenome]|uniref:Endonuclease/exonuclease/phosphatase domain-containing protein n=1 Tax=hydrothermal vent metagenome TaxID=652676 RepID=A0A3B0ZCA8_9ZZZZ
MKNKRDISFATFNLYNFQLPGKRMRYNSTPYTDDEYTAKLFWTSSMLKKVDADVIAFQELWSKQCLEDAFVHAGMNDDYTLHFIKDQWYNIAVAIAVRNSWTVLDKKIHKSFPDDFILRKRGGGANDDQDDDEVEVNIDRFSRSVMQLSIGHATDDSIKPVQVFAVHLKSKLGARLDQQEAANERIKPHRSNLGSALSTIRRTAEAAALRWMLTDMMKNSDEPVVVIGDINDSTLSNTLSIITAQPRLRRAFDSRTGNRSDNGLYTAGLLQELRSLNGVYYSHVYNDVRELIDHVLVSEQFYDHSSNRVWSFNKMTVWSDHLEDDDKASTDHGVVKVAFDYRP